MATAVLKHYRAKPRKTRQLADMIRGKRVSEALILLQLSTRAASRDMEKLVRSALANATDKGENDDPDALVVHRVMVDQGPTLKRFRARARGRTGKILKRTCHIHLEGAQTGFAYCRRCGFVQCITVATSEGQRPNARAVVGRRDVSRNGRRRC